MGPHSRLVFISQEFGLTSQNFFVLLGDRFASCILRLLIRWISCFGQIQAEGSPIAELLRINVIVIFFFVVVVVASIN
jgi:hypothetical protein